MQQTRATVHIAGQTINLRGTDDEAYIQSLASYVQKCISQVENKNPALSTTNCVIMSALNIADELFKLQQKYDELDQRIEELRQLNAPAPASSPTPRRTNKTPVKRPFEEPVNTK
ncbi:cell division protein ZapA [Eubacteriales bacterium OttesenSCG-928-K08]|nr:cell division protein ZapA [Eubacteriales bacterium OttesenSCG-928-K08]